MNQQDCDFLIIGGGIAGLSAALEASKHGKVILLTKGKMGETATQKAQGGIAAAIDQMEDSTEFHFEDTLAAGAGLCNEEAVRILVNEGVERVKELIEMGAQFDRAETEGGGTKFALAIEGAHRKRRILHAGDTTGEEIQRTLGSRIISEGKVEIHDQTLGIDLIVKDGKCVGAFALSLPSNHLIIYQSKTTIIATGGLCQVYLYTTNPPFATGDGIAMAYRAGTEVTDMEFVQFHPTSLVHTKEFEDIIALPRFLISEAVRGEGAELLNVNGKRFISELAPRDVVSKAIFEEMKRDNSEYVFLSLVKLGTEKIKKRFPIIYKTCLERGLDITKDNIPVAPAAHYFMGGIKTDINGKTNLPALFAAGECASLGIHGANRLASNSLLDGLVFGHRAAIAASGEIPTVKLSVPGTAPTSRGSLGSKLSETDILRLKMIIKSTMWNEVGIVRSAKSLKDALKILEELEKKLKEETELKNMALVAKLITRAALDRKESRGAHCRSDFPKTDDKNWKKHLVYSKMS